MFLLVPAINVLQPFLIFLLIGLSNHPLGSLPQDIFFLLGIFIFGTLSLSFFCMYDLYKAGDTTSLYYPYVDQNPALILVHRSID